MIKKIFCLIICIITSPFHLLYKLNEKLNDINFAWWLSCIWIFGVPFAYTRSHHAGVIFWFFWFLGIGIVYGAFVCAIEMIEFILSFPERIYQKCEPYAKKCFNCKNANQQKNNQEYKHEQYSHAWQAYERYKRTMHNNTYTSSSNNNQYSGEANEKEQNQEYNYQRQQRYQTDTPSSTNEYANAMKLFGLTGTYTQEELKKKYRELLKKYHPDNYNGDDTYAKKINEAYSLLKSR